MLQVLIIVFSKHYYDVLKSDSSTTITAEPVKRPCLFISKYYYSVTLSHQLQYSLLPVYTDLLSFQLDPIVYIIINSVLERLAQRTPVHLELLGSLRIPVSSRSRVTNKETKEYPSYEYQHK